MADGAGFTVAEAVEPVPGETTDDAPTGGLTPEQVADELGRLARLSRLDYERERRGAAQSLGLGVVALDKAVKAQHREQRLAAAQERRALPAPAAGEVRWPFGVFMQADGLHADTGTGTDAGTAWLAAPFEVLGDARDAAGEGWSLWLRWNDRDGRPHTWPMPARLLMVGPGELEAALVERGLRVSPDPAARMQLRRALGEVQAGSRVTLVTRAGWHTPADGAAAYVLPDGEVIGSAAEALVLRAPPEAGPEMVRQAGTLAGWQREVAALAVGNPVIAFCIAAALAGPLLDPCGEASGGFHLSGRSKVGKTLALRMALSAWGPPFKGAALRDWRSTANGLEGAAEEAGDGLLALDELHQADPREVAGAVYMIANESGKGRMRRDTSAQRRRTWRTFILSIGELDVAAVVAKAGQSLPAGAEVRLPSIGVDAASTWPALHGRANSGALMAELHGAVRRQHGTAARAFLAQLAGARSNDADGLAAFAAAMRDRYAAALPADADPQVRDVARRCALVALAGELARAWGVLPWPEGEAERAAQVMLARWLAKRGTSASAEEAQHVRAVRLFLTEHGASRFVALHFDAERRSWQESHPDRAVVKRAGWRRRQPDGRDEYLIASEVWRELCAEAGIDPAETGRTLRAAGFLDIGDGKNLARTVRLPGVGKARLYVIRPDLMGEGEAA